MKRMIGTQIPVAAWGAAAAARRSGDAQSRETDAIDATDRSRSNGGARQIILPATSGAMALLAGSGRT